MLHLDLAWQKYSKSVKKYQTPFKKFLFVDLCYLYKTGAARDVKN